jgi:F-type H+-transporting ATPase subunit epsilon
VFKLSIVTTDGPVFEDTVTSIIAPGGLGYLGLLTDHTPIMTTLTPGVLTIAREQGGKFTLMIGEGFLENSPDPKNGGNRCLILTRSVEFASRQDLDQAMAYREAADVRLRQAGSADETGARTLEQLDRLIATAGKTITEGRQ